MDFFKHFELFA